MSYEAWTWIMIGLIIIAIAGLVATIILDISKRGSPGALTGARTLLSVVGIIGAAGFASLSLGVFPLGHPGSATSTHSGVTTGQSGIVTQGQKSTTATGQ
ncbi:MAG TPA: hypothetical protein VL752_07615 [Acidisoma sp.]|uniref:hypothetical protein n=1 Tax=Acidisoma sp. TaxID=1872115 RepID=UPI002C78A5D4|nr:hypothetical protein [Acidisoma sp.]HTI00798.1 hypothetical protein [Acidisoma sp.]